jgi:hypothetical protein
MQLGPHWSSSGIINNMKGGLSNSKTGSGMTITSGGLDEHGKRIVPRSSRHDGKGLPSDDLHPVPMANEQADRAQRDAMTGSSSGYSQACQAQMPIVQIANAHELENDSSWTGQVMNVIQDYKPRYMGTYANDVWNVLKGKGQKGGGGQDAWTISPCQT